MDFLMIAVLFVFGLIIGSFLNVVILRWNTGMRISKGRSVCFSCGKMLHWYELVPLVSFIIQKGACKGCGTKISRQYPLVELSGGLAFVIAFIRVPDAFSNAFSLVSFILFILSAALLCVFIVIFVYDLRYKIIPDFFSYLAALIALAMIALEWGRTGHADPYQMIAGAALFLFFWAFWYFSKGTWMGLGDGKLALSIGWALGLSGGISALLFAFWTGAIVSLAIMAFEKLMHKKKGLRMRSEIPFGPFLIIGFLIVFLGHIDIQAIFSYLAV